MMKKHKKAFEQIYNNAVTIRAEKDVMNLSMSEAPSTCVSSGREGEYTKKEGLTNIR